jgi:hypothetical protein
MPENEKEKDNYVDEEVLSDYHGMIFDCLNKDLSLLILHILLEGHFRSLEGVWIFTLDQFIKHNYLKIGEINEEASDTNDFYSLEGMVFNQVVYIIEDLNLAKIKRVGINKISELPTLLMKKAFAEKDPTEQEVEYYASMIDEIYKLKSKNDEKASDLKAGFDMKDFKEWREKHERADFDTSYEASKHIGFAFDIAPSQIEIEVVFNDEVAKMLNKEIEDYLFGFSQDDYFEQKPTYREKRYYFSKQLENFYNYIKKLPEINGNVNIPFSSLTEEGFEVVKMLSYLEREKILKVNNWDDVDMWNVKFHKQPITLESIIPVVRNENPLNDSKENGKNKKIQKITIIKTDTGKFLIAVNDDYSETREVKGSSEMWKIFIKEVEDRNIKPETRTDVKEISKAMADYFNYNAKKCPIYMGGKYALTEIFTGRGIDTTINPEIKTEIINENKLSSRKKRKGKK